MKILIKYLKPYKWLVLLTLILAAINQTFSLFDPMIFGKLIDQFANHPHSTTEGASRTQGDFINGILFYLALLVGTAMVSRIAKAFQDYFSNVIIQKFGARIFTDGLKHSMRLPYQDFEDQRSGETLSILSKVRSDTERLLTIQKTNLLRTAYIRLYAAEAASKPLASQNDQGSVRIPT